MQLIIVPIRRPALPTIVRELRAQKLTVSFGFFSRALWKRAKGGNSKMQLASEQLPRASFVSHCFSLFLSSLWARLQRATTSRFLSPSAQTISKRRQPTSDTWPHPSCAEQVAPAPRLRSAARSGSDLRSQGGHLCALNWPARAPAKNNEEILEEAAGRLLGRARRHASARRHAIELASARLLMLIAGGALQWPLVVCFLPARPLARREARS